MRDIVKPQAGDLELEGADSRSANCAEALVFGLGSTTR